MIRSSALLAILCISFFATAASAAEVKEVVSAKGIKAWLVEEHSLPLVAVHVAFEGAGFAHDRSGQEGRANMAAQLLTEGAGDMDARAFNKALESRAITMNAGANEDLLEVSVQSLSEHKDLAFSYLSQMLAKPRFDKDAMERVRRQILASIKQAEQTPEYQMERAFMRQAFGDHPYAQPELGTSSSVGRLDTYDMQHYTETYMTQENMLVAVVGDVTPDELKTLLDKYFTGLPTKYKPDAKLAEVKIAKGGKPKVVDFAIPQTMIAFGLQGLKRNDPDYIPAYILNQILGGDGLSSRLWKEIREKRGLSYGVYSQMAPYSAGAVWKGSFSTRNEEAKNALAVLKDTLDTFAKDGPTEAELSDAKKYLTGSFVLNLDSNADLAAFLINMQYNRLGKDYLDKRNDMIEAVTRKQVQALAKQLIDTQALITVLVGKPDIDHAVSP